MDIRGLTAEQKIWADWMWMEDDYAKVSLACEEHVDARIVRDMIIAHELDSYMEVTDDVQSYLSSH